MSTAGAILAVLGTFAIPVIIFGGAEWLGEREHRAAIRARLKSLGPIEPSDDLLGDLPHVPEITVFHFGTDSTWRRNDHAGR